ncbi:class I SAM-dependent methyltransferase [Erwinia pyrifoliae]|uniref:Methyltransferase domain-containing protein n=1 Tax=Erwinia pyrifoliae TaxID=79967 RepID=A0ABY5X5I4_ERWPY|nr:class I SAM-dependent methyltransferase [Erwinia pyrifoliae]UWS32650.1 methyltransferase domain-containing protein [Erwinia pyrifoliae]
MATNHHDNINRQFGEQANAYLTSAVHAAGADLLRLGERLSETPEARVLDIGCGAGHASFVAAQYVKEIVAYDLSERMLATVDETAAARGYRHLTTQQGYAENLPFGDAEFDIVISRYSAHHWHDVGSALREVRRVLKAGGKMILIDVSAPGNPVLNIWLQTVEALRDASHVQDYSPGEWLTLMTESGLIIQRASQEKLELEFSSWIERMRTPEVMVQAIRAYQHSAPDDVQRYYALQPDGSFSTDTLFIEAIRP